MEQAEARNAEVLEAARAFKGFTYSKSIYYLEPWSMPGFAQREQAAMASGMAMLKAKIDRGEIPGIVKGQGRIFLKKRRCEFPIPGAGELREKRPDFVPSSGDSGANVKRLEYETAEKINHLSTECSRISNDVVQLLLKQVTDS